MKTSVFDASRYLRSEEEVATYLRVAAEEAAEYGDNNILLQAIEDAAKARGMMQVAKDAGVSRESLYRSLAEGAQPRFDTITKVLGALGVQFAVVPKQKTEKQTA